MSKSCNDRLARADALAERGRFFIATGEYDQAIETARTCIDLYHDLGRSRFSMANIILAKALRLKGAGDAETPVRAGLEAAQLVGHRPDIAAAYEVLGALAADQKDYTLAEQYYQQSLTVWEEIGHEPEIAFILCRIAAIQVMVHPPEDDRIDAQLMRALHLAKKHQAALAGMAVLAGLEVLQVLSGAKHLAAERLSYVLYHPATTFEVRQWVKNFMSQVGLLPLSPSEIAEIASSNWQTLAEGWKNTSVL